MNKDHTKWLIAIVAATLLIRLILAFTIPNLTYDSYFHMRQVEHITETGLPLYSDDLSYGGREHLFLPLFHYLAALFALVIPLEFVAKILPNILLSTLPILVYLISYQIRAKNSGPLFSAFIAGFLPTIFATNSFTPLSLFLPLIFLTIYAYLTRKKKNHTWLYVGALLAATLTSAATFLLLIGFGIYLILGLLERRKVKREEGELILFSLFFFVWVQFLFFKNTLIQEGTRFITQNVPQQILDVYFPTVSIAESLLLVSAIPFIAGVYVVYQSLFKAHNRKAFLMISFAISTTLLAWLKLIEFNLSLAFFSLILAILFRMFYTDMVDFIQRTKLSHKRKTITAFLVLLLLVTTVTPAISTAFTQKTPSDSTIDAVKWINKNTPEDSGVLGRVEEGHLITFYSKRRNIIDDVFVGIDDVDKRFTAVNSVFASAFQTNALRTLAEYNAQYLLFTAEAAQSYEKEKFSFLTEQCFKWIYEEESSIYLVRCGLESR